ncbi:HD domain-containing protein [bacterium]|nr:HD domain-containing protein [bacterium]
MITKLDIEQVFAEQLKLVSDHDLRDKTVMLWVDMCAKGGWRSLTELEAMPFTLLTNARGISFLEHTIAVTEGAYALGKAMQKAYKKMPYTIDFDRLVVGGLLHDIGKLVEIESDGQGGYRKSFYGRCTRHPISGAIEAGQAGFGHEILNIIACHAKEGENRPQVIETVLIHQADFATFDPLTMLEKGLLIQS